MRYAACIIALICVALASCQQRPIIHADDPDLVQIQKRVHEQQLVSLNIMDRNGLTETISAKDRLKNYDNVNFLTTQPYQKVLRVFAKDKSGNALSVITSYYPSGQIRQYLECLNGRAHGRYIEWHPNGQKKLQSTILGGNADLDEKSQTTWTFHERSYCWNEEGKLVADIPYEQGLLVGVSRYYYPSGVISEEIPYSKGEIEGVSNAFDEHGAILESTNYVRSLKSGKSTGFWTTLEPQWEEEWKDDLLQEGRYFSKDSTLVCQVEKGTGKRCLFGDEGPLEIQEYVDGKPEGEVVIFDEKGTIIRRLFVKGGEKHGEEIYYWPNNPTEPKLSIQWLHGQIHGVVKTWYADGSPESSREMSHNLKQGLLTAWYKDGRLMLIEEYEKDRLVRGDYLKMGDNKPVSQVIDGKGLATFYDEGGIFKERMRYLDGKPVLDDLHAAR